MGITSFLRGFLWDNSFRTIKIVKRGINRHAIIEINFIFYKVGFRFYVGNIFCGVRSCFNSTFRHCFHRSRSIVNSLFHVRCPSMTSTPTNRAKESHRQCTHKGTNTLVNTFLRKCSRSKINISIFNSGVLELLL